MQTNAHSNNRWGGGDPLRVHTRIAACHLQAPEGSQTQNPTRPSTTRLTYIISTSCSHLHDNDLVTPTAREQSTRRRPLGSARQHSADSFFPLENCCSLPRQCGTNSCYGVPAHIPSLQSRSTAYDCLIVVGDQVRAGVLSGRMSNCCWEMLDAVAGTPSLPSAK